MTDPTTSQHKDCHHKGCHHKDCHPLTPQRVWDRRRMLAGMALGSLGLFLPARGVEAKAAGLRGYLRTNWSRDPFALGSDSYLAKTERQADRRDLAAPVDDRLFFAGEAVHPRYNSTVHAAYESGRAAAKDLLKTQAKSIAVIGAGISGLAAAHRLAQKPDREVSVLEARPRIGGRIWTNHELGLPLDLGASWIHGTRGNPITGLARRADAELVATDERYVIRGRKGRRLDDDEVPDWLENVVYFQHDAAADISQLDLQAFEDEPEYSGRQVIFPAGYGSILSSLEGPYQTRLDTKVTKIVHGADGVTLHTTQGRQSFDAVLVTLPLGVLKRGSVTFQPALSTRKQRAIRRLGVGTLDKLYLLFDEAFWDRRATWIVTPENGLPEGHFNQWLNLDNYLDAPLIMAFNGGPPALELSSYSDDALVQMALRTLKRAYPD